VSSSQFACDIRRFWCRSEWPDSLSPCAQPPQLHVLEFAVDYSPIREYERAKIFE
jgi:hypothetical protein